MKMVVFMGFIAKLVVLWDLMVVYWDLMVV
jgi:hypothetical protein